MTQTSENSNRFQHLIPPIRDLAQNWSIDLASQLEDYLEEIEQIPISFNNGKTTINFVEAAFLIQGSAAVFSKKVEYLYTLVYQTLELLASKRQLQLEGASPNSSATHTAQTHIVNDIDEFLELNDLPTANVQLKEDDDSVRAGERNFRPLPQTPLVLVPINTLSQASMTPLVSSKSEVIGRREDFRLMTATLHQSGALLLEPNLARIVDYTMNNTRCQPETFARRSSLLHSPMNMHSMNSPEVDQGASFSTPPPSSPTHAEVLYASPKTPQLGNPNASDNVVMASINSSAHRSDVLENLLNPYDTAKGVEKPFKKGVTWKMPQSLHAHRLPVKRKSTKLSDTDSNSFILQLTEDLCSGSRFFSKNIMLKLHFLSLEEGFWQEQRRREDLTKRFMKSQQRTTFYNSNSASNMIYSLDIPQTDYSDNDSETGEILANAGQFEHDDPPNFDIQPAFDAPELFQAYSTDRQIPYNNELDEGREGMVYNRLVRRHLEEAMHRAEKHAQTSELSNRIEEWRYYVQPKLDKQAESCFDIHKTSLDLIYRIQLLDKAEKVPWKKVVKGMSEQSVAQAFLTTLVLANNRNIDLDCDAVLNSEAFCVSLINSTPVFEEVANFVLPSFAAGATNPGILNDININGSS